MDAELGQLFDTYLSVAQQDGSQQLPAVWAGLDVPAKQYVAYLAVRTIFYGPFGVRKTQTVTLGGSPAREVTLASVGIHTGAWKALRRIALQYVRSKVPNPPPGTWAHQVNGNGKPT